MLVSSQSVFFLQNQGEPVTEDARILTEDLTNLPFHTTLTSVKDTSQSSLQGTFTCAASAEGFTSDACDNLHPVSVFPTTSNLDELLRQHAFTSCDLQNQITASHQNTAVDPASFQLGQVTITCNLDLSQRNVIFHDPTPLQGYAINICDLQNQTPASNHNTVIDVPSLQEQITATGGILNQTDSGYQNTVIHQNPLPGHTVSSCDLQNQTATGSQSSSIDPTPPQWHTPTSSDLQSQPSRGSENTFIDLLELFDECDLNATGLPCDSIDGWEMMDIGEEDCMYSVGDHCSNGAEDQEKGFEELALVQSASESSEVLGINLSVLEPGNEPGGEAEKEPATAHPDVRSGRHSFSGGLETCVTTLNLSQNPAFSADEDETKSFNMSLSILNSSCCTTGSADSSMAYSSAGDRNVSHVNGSCAFPERLPEIAGAAGVALPGKTD